MVTGLSDPTAPDSTIFVKGLSGKLATPKASSDGAAALKGISGKLLSPKGAAGKAPILAAAGVGSVKDHFQELQASLQELRSDAALGGGVKPYGRSSQVRGAPPSLFERHSLSSILDILHALLIDHVSSISILHTFRALLDNYPL